MARLSHFPPLLCVLLLASCLSSCLSSGPSSDPRDYPVTMRPELAGVRSSRARASGDRTAFIGMWNDDGRELITGEYDIAAQHFVEGTIMIFGRLPEEYSEGDMGDIEEMIGRQECSFLLSCADPGIRGGFLRAQGPTNRGVGTGQEQALLAFGGLVSLLAQRDVAEAQRRRGRDPCAPPIRRDYCTWSPELFPIACCKHDVCYANCRTAGHSQSECDAQFLADMRVEASFWTAPFVPVYYAAARAFGGVVYGCD